MHTMGDICKALNRSAVYVSGLQARFDLPAMAGAAYSDAYLACLRSIVSLRTFNIPEDTLRDLWHLEKKLLQLLHVDSLGSPSWFLDDCGATTHPERRLLLTNYDLGEPLGGSSVQSGLNFGESVPELFAGQEMGEDAIRVLHESLEIRARILADLATELPNVRASIKWAAALAKQSAQRKS